MRPWPGLFAAPAAFLTALAAAYALVPWACERQSAALLHAVNLAAIAVAAGATVHAWRLWRVCGATLPHDDGDEAARRRFLAMLSLLLGALMCLATLALWIPSWIVPPCVR